MPKILPLSIFIVVLALVTQFARTAPNPNQQTEAANPSTESQFRLKQSYPIRSEIGEFLATIYSCGSGQKQKEILSIWSRESNAYELQYIRTAAAGQTFAKPEMFSNEKSDFIQISTRDRNNGATSVQTILVVTDDLTVNEIPTKRNRSFKGL